jgi:hypothetical protein
MKALNIGCGKRFHPGWANLDLNPASAQVRSHDVSKGIPYPDSSFDVVYHSHLLEHLERKSGAFLLSECHRVLRRGGVVRVVVPDLERIAQLYLQALERASSGASEWHGHYEWMMLELYDQTVRARSGGAMLQFALGAGPADLNFIEERIGEELADMLAVGNPVQRDATAQSRDRLSQLPRVAVRYILRMLVGRDRLASYYLGRFRQSGEIHLCMYDRYSLGRALEAAGFTAPLRVAANQSVIPNWAEFHLDTEPDGHTRKPDSLFMEATRT